MKFMATVPLSLFLSLSLGGAALFSQEEASPSDAVVRVQSPEEAKPAGAAAVVNAVPAAAEKPAAPKRAWKSEEALKRLPGHVAATGEGASGGGRGGEAVSAAPPAWRLLLAFVVMAVLLFGLYKFLKKYGRRMTGQEAGSLKVLSRVSLDGKNSLVLVKFYEEELLLGVNSSGGVGLVAKCSQLDIAEAEDAAGKVAESDMGAPGEGEFLKNFGKISASDLKSLKGRGL